MLVRESLAVTNVVLFHLLYFLQPLPSTFYNLISHLPKIFYSMYMSPRTPCIGIPISCIALPCNPMFMFGIDRLMVIEFLLAGLVVPFCIIYRMSGVLCC